MCSICPLNLNLGCIHVCRGCCVLELFCLLAWVLAFDLQLIKILCSVLYQTVWCTKLFNVKTPVTWMSSKWTTEKGVSMQGFFMFNIQPWSCVSAFGAEWGLPAQTDYSPTGQKGDLCSQVWQLTFQMQCPTFLPLSLLCVFCTICCMPSLPRLDSLILDRNLAIDVPV